MKSKNAKDIFEMITEFQKKVLAKKPPQEAMYDEVRMMKFKIRPLQGEITQLDLKNNRFIEMLWGLGKLDEFYQIHVDKLSGDQKDVFFRIFNGLHQQFQDEVSRISFKKQADPNASAFEMEIFKERSENFN